MRVTRRRLLGGLAAATSTPSWAFGAQDGASPQTRLFIEGRYLPIWLALRSAPADVPLQQMASFVGDEAFALSRASRGPIDDETLTHDARDQNALDAIVSAARERRVVFLNEAHVASRHRCFLAQVLRALRPLGFDTLACEDFANSSTKDMPRVQDYNSRAPLDPQYGFYLHDPLFADAIRQAVGLGYRLAPYEQRADQRIEGEGRMEAIARREAAEASNFTAEILAPHPKSRVLVYCGYSHLRKTPDRQGNEWFARRLKAATGIDPLCISQAFTGSFGPHAPDSPLTQAVLARFSPNRSIVVTNSDGRSVGAAASGADLAVFHPPTPDIDRRPGWLATDPGRRRVEVTVPRERGDAPLIVQALHAADAEIAIPADQQVLAAGEPRAVLFLRPGAYRLRVETEAGFAPLETRTIQAFQADTVDRQSLVL